MLTLALGALATLRATLQVSIMGIMVAITTTTITITTKRQRSRLNAVCLSEGWRWIVSGIGRTLFY